MEEQTVQVMMDNSESPREAAVRKPSLNVMTPKTRMKIGAWNVRTLASTGKLSYPQERKKKEQRKTKNHMEKNGRKGKEGFGIHHMGEGKNACKPKRKVTVCGLAKDNGLQYMMLNVMTNMWMKNDRCFVHLLKMVNDVNETRKKHKGKDYDQLLLSLALAIRNICVHSPSQRGEELLPLLSGLLNDEASPPSVCALTLQGIYSLCEAEVIDLQTTWQVLAPRLRDEKNVIIIKEVCKLLNYTKFLSTIVADEVKTLPNSSYHPKSQHIPKNSNEKILTAIPVKISQLFHSHNHSFKDNIAFGMLLCSQFDTETNEMNLQALISKAKEAQHILSQVVSDLSLDVSNWRRCIFISGSWTSFMNKLFSISIEGRKAELKFQQSKGKLNGSEKEIEAKASCQGNAVIALASLLTVSSNYFKNLSDKEQNVLKEATEHMQQAHWECVISETILGVINSKHKTSEDTLRWLRNSSTMSGNVFSSAATLALVIILPYVTNSSEKLIYFMKLISSPLASDEPDRSVHFYHGLALGMLIPQMYKSCGIEISDLRLIHKLRTMCFSENEFRILTMSCELCSYALAICTATVTSLALISKLITIGSAEHLLVILDERRQESQNCCGTASALGILIRCFLIVKHERAMKLSLLSRLAALNGLAAMFGLDSSLVHVSCTSSLRPERQGRTDTELGDFDLYNVKIDVKHVNACLECLNQQFNRPLPPLDWNNLLAGIIVKYSDSITLKLCLELLLNQYRTSISAQNTLNPFFTPSVFLSLHALVGMLKISEPPQGFIALMQEFTSSTFLEIVKIPALIHDDGIRTSISEILAELPPKLLDELIQPVDEYMNEILLLRFQLIGTHHCSLSSINLYFQHLHKG
ncbi:Focadhesin [Nymphon striatum]|nr:Focadhesin [Nymphon striatum]